MSTNTIAERLQARSQPQPNGCILWTGAHNGKGYGMLNHNRKNIATHRAAYEINVGPIPAGMMIDHKCHNPSCINPQHLRLATHKQNRENLGHLVAANKSRFRGVSWNKRERKWRAKVKHNNVVVFEKNYTNIEEAAAAAVEQRNLVYTHNDHDRLGINPPPLGVTTCTVGGPQSAAGMEPALGGAQDQVSLDCGSSVGGCAGVEV